MGPCSGPGVTAKKPVERVVQKAARVYPVRRLLADLLDATTRNKFAL